MKKPELIAPAGDLEKLKVAFQYGADAVYASTPKFSMRTREIGFDFDSLKEGIKFAHDNGKKIYLTVNTFPHSSEIPDIREHTLRTIKLKPDAIIASDPGIIEIIKNNSDIPIHLSTQSNTTNYLAADFWYRQGVSRVVLARELSLEDIKLIAEHSKIELESFVHGAMCMAYSGRCQISNYMTGRDANRGACAQPCRFKYKLYGLEEDLRKDEYFQIYEDDRGAYLLNSKDLCMVNHIPELIDAGITSFKIEGRLKSIYYVGIITRTYRKAIDLYFSDSKKYEKEKPNFVEEVKKTSNRGFTKGFYFDKPDSDTNNYETSRAKSEWGFVGIVKSYDQNKKMVTIEVKNRIRIGDKIEIITPSDLYELELKSMFKKGESIKAAHANYIIEFPFEHELPEDTFIRAKSLI